MTAKQAKRRLEQELRVVDRVIGSICYRKSLRVEDRQEFYSFVMLKLVENDYRRIRKFQGLSRFRTYLTTVVRRLYSDFQTQQLGDWHPSTRARSLGETAVELEKLLYQKGHSFDESVAILASSRHRQSRETLWAWQSQFPMRNSRRESRLEESHLACADGSASERIYDRERRDKATKLEADMRIALQRLNRLDWLLVKMSILDEVSVAKVSNVLGLQPKTAYTRRSRAIEKLRKRLEAKNWDKREIGELLGWSHFNLTLVSPLINKSFLKLKTHT